MTSPQILSAVYNQARLGLTEIAKDTRNTPAQIAQQAAALEQWREESEAGLAKAAKDAEPAPAKAAKAAKPAKAE